ncbi:MAG TPA: Uma2 family endonuclease [Chthonomonadaceae bacterium]|nr:Uma2 family endonuclease [Chthonomonadaceae bacterium]
MADTLVMPERVMEARAIRVSERPITFEQFLTIEDRDAHLELVQGVLEERMSAQLEHESLHLWLVSLLRVYVGKLGLGTVLGSRTAVEINQFAGRLPDILFVRKENEAIIQSKAIYGTPDLVIEIVSPNDRPSDLIALEADYRSIKVPEIVFIDARRRRLHLLHKHENDYEETILTEGVWRSEAIEGIELPVTWLLDEPRPEVYDVLTTLLTSS